MIKVLIFVIEAILRGMGFVINLILVGVSEKVSTKPQYIQGFGGETYQSKQPAKRAATVTVTAAPVMAFTPSTLEAVRDPLVLRTPQELNPGQNQLKGRAAPPTSARVVTIPLEADGGLPIGTAWLYLYEKDEAGNALNKARRVLKFSNRALAKIICGPDECRYFFKDVEFTPGNGSAELTKQFINEIKTLLDRKNAISRHAKVKIQAPQKIEPPAEKPVDKSKVVPVAIATPLPTVKPPEVAKTAPEKSFPIDRSVKGAVYQGIVVSAGLTEKNGREGKYTTFCLTINDGNKEIPLNGTEIERQVRDMSIRVGEHIKVVSMGRADVPGFEHQGWKKSLYQLTRLGGVH